MRVCPKHFAKASETLRSLKTEEEFDLCPECEIELREILHDKPDEKPERPAVTVARSTRRGRPSAQDKK